MLKSILAAALAAGLVLAAPIETRADDDEHHGAGMHHEMKDEDAGGMGMMGGMGCPMMQGKARMHEKGGMMHDAKMMEQMTEKRLAGLKTELKITDAQTEAWNGYVAAVKARGEAMTSNRESMMKAMKEGTALTRLDTHITAMERMLGALKTLKPATEKLYSVLDDGQKKIADAGLGHGCMM